MLSKLFKKSFAVFFLALFQLQVVEVRADDVIIDVMVVYSPEARAAAGSQAAIEALIDQAVFNTNEAYANSGVNQSLNLVHTAETDSESGDFNTDLDRLRDPNDTFMDEIHALRDEHGADVVSLIVVNNDLCGLAFTMTNPSPSFESFAFSVVSRTCAVFNRTFAHELGHNMGCRHDRDDTPGDGAFPYSHGHRWTGNSGNLWRSIMATTPGDKVGHFSNPQILFDGVPTGVDHNVDPLNSADNARSLNGTATIVSSFRVFPNGTPSTVVYGDTRGFYGETNNQRAVIENIGDVPLVRVKLKLYLSDNDTFSGGDTLVDTITVDAINPGESSVEEFSFTVPIDWPTDEIYPLVILELDGVLHFDDAVSRRVGLTDCIYDVDGSGTVNIADALLIIIGFQNAQDPSFVQWNSSLDVDSNSILDFDDPGNDLVNFSDVQMAILAFQNGGCP